MTLKRRERCAPPNFRLEKIESAEENNLMRATKTETIPTVDHKPHAAFFRQSGWLMIATVIGGGMAMVVHTLAKSESISKAEYAAFGTLLMVVSCVPGAPLQMVFAQQSAAALATGRERQLSRLIRLAWLWTFAVWLLVAAAVLIFQKQIVAGWHLPSATALWVTLPLLLFALWGPMFGGILQGRQDFFWMGWSGIASAVGRLAVAALLVLLLKLGAVGMMAGVLFGVGLGVTIGIVRTRDLWSAPSEPLPGKAIWREVAWLMLGFGACQFMFTSDTMFAKAHFSDDEMGPYVAAGTLSRSLLWLVMPLAAVMFPKIVRSSAKNEKNNLFGLVVLGTAVLSICGGLGLWLVGPLAIKIVYKDSYLGAAALIPWYAAAMVPLALANVMVNDLLARARYAVVPWMIALAVIYGFTAPWMLNHFPGRIEVVLQTLGAFNLLLFLLCAWFVWGGKGQSPEAKV
jgi:O-antigen/teichoic acid export membrane protein